MSASDIIKIAPGVVRAVDRGHAIYTGTSDALIAAGIILAHQLPELAGEKRATCTLDAAGEPAAGTAAMQNVGAKQVTAKLLPRGVLYEVREVLEPQQVVRLGTRPAGRLRPRIGAPEPMAPVRPVRCASWPFPVSYGRASTQPRGVAA